MPDCNCTDWHAIHDRMPPGPATLRVTATCECPRGGYTLRLERQEPQGINSKDLLLRLVEEPPEVGPDVMTECHVKYTEDTDFEYDTVSILPDGPMGIRVENVA